MKIHTTNEMLIDLIRSQMCANAVDNPFRRLSVDEDGNLHFSTYDTKGIRHDFCMEIYEIK